MTNFQKIISLFGAFVVLIVGYYFLVALPKHNAEMVNIAEKEVILEERKQEHAEFQKEKELTKEEQLKEEQLLLEKKKNCQERGDKMKETYSNIFSVYYNEILDGCYVRYYNDEDEIETAHIDQGGPVKKEEINPLYGRQVIINGVNFREFPSINGGVIQKIDPSNYVIILGNREVDGQLWYRVDFYGTEGRISGVAFGQ